MYNQKTCHLFACSFVTVSLFGVFRISTVCRWSKGGENSMVSMSVGWMRNEGEVVMKCIAIGKFKLEFRDARLLKRNQWIDRIIGIKIAKGSIRLEFKNIVDAT